MIPPQAVVAAWFQLAALALDRIATRLLEAADRLLRS